jgi:hypothetical protein
MPAHVAPLGLTFYTSDRISNLKDQMLVSWHGYREYGQKVVSFELDESGLPVSDKPNLVIFNWAARAGIRPQGAPVGITPLNDGRLLVIDDKNKSILVLSDGMEYADGQTMEEEVPVTTAQLAAIVPLQAFFKTNCASCHPFLREPDSGKLVKNLLNSPMVNLDDPMKSPLYMRVQKREMPIGNRLDESDYQESLSMIKAFLSTLESDR